MSESKKARLLWVDLEMTGLDPAKDRIVEAAAIATDFEFNEIARYEATVKTSSKLMHERMVGKFWDDNNESRQALLDKNSSSTAKQRKVVEAELIDFIKVNFDMDQPIYLAGNSIYNDRKFIEREWPELDAMLHYRLLDVSAWKIVFMEHGAKFQKPEKHRAMSDIEGSMEELKYYLKKVKF